MTPRPLYCVHISNIAMLICNLHIVISIPDIEAHIQNELQQSPSPTSHRVGVPLPTKSRAGVSIPQGQQRTRRQVQIFDSQPLASPGRSVDKPRNGHTSLSMSARHGNSGSGSNSANGSYVAQMHLSRLTGSGPNMASGTAKSLSSGAFKFASLSTSASRSDHLPASKSDSRLDSKQIVPAPSAPKPIFASTPSTSSSVSSTLASTITGSSSLISTPPTSLSYSLGSAVAGLMGFAGTGDSSRSGYPDAAGKLLDDEREGLPVHGRKGKGKMTIEDQLEDTSSMSWRDSLGIPSSWKEKLSASISSSCKSSSGSYGKSRLSKVQSNDHSSNGHSRTSSAGFWKDPGTAAPAPAVVVSAVVGADGEEGAGNYFDLASGIAGSSSTSASSSATATVVRPSRNGSPTTADQIPLKKIISISNASGKLVSDTPEVPPTVSPASVPQHPIIASSLNSSNATPSLLTQTAPSGPPIRPPLSYPLHRPDLRPSPSHHVSQLSAHMHSQPSTSHNTSDHSPHDHKVIHTPSRTNILNNYPTNTWNLPPTSLATSPSLTPTPAMSPPPPPPTPVTTPAISSFLPGFVSIRTAPIPIAESERPPAPDPPPVSIKIADLGNATPSTKHFTDDIQTRQYRAPEAILGKRDWDATADIWSVACVVGLPSSLLSLGFIQNYISRLLSS